VPPLPPPATQHWDGTGGNGSALRHFEATGSKYPLVVKLGTITPAGADVYSYAPDEEDMVTDPLLAQHLAHWGIDMQKVRDFRPAAPCSAELLGVFVMASGSMSGGAHAPLLFRWRRRRSRWQSCR
jgi:ubiquitin carboxyl-terminal hydrolase 5/13